MWKRGKSKARQKIMIGFTARMDGNIRQLRRKSHRKVKDKPSRRAPTNEGPGKSQ